MPADLQSRQGRDGVALTRLWNTAHKGFLVHLVPAEAASNCAVTRCSFAFSFARLEASAALAGARPEAFTPLAGGVHRLMLATLAAI